MTVQELIERLQRFDPDCQVTVWSGLDDVESPTVTLHETKDGTVLISDMYPAIDEDDYDRSG